MERFTVQLTDERKRDFFLELLESLDFVQVVRTTNGHAAKENLQTAHAKKKPLSAKKRALVESIKEGLREVELHQQGKIQLQSAKEFIAELRSEV